MAWMAVQTWGQKKAHGFHGLSDIWEGGFPTISASPHGVWVFLGSHFRVPPEIPPIGFADLNEKVIRLGLRQPPK